MEENYGTILSQHINGVLASQRTNHGIVVGPNTYKDLAEKFLELAQYKDYVDLKIWHEEEDISGELEISAYITRKVVTAPDGKWDEIKELNPTWCAYHTFIGPKMRERINDFTFQELSRWIVD